MHAALVQLQQVPTCHLLHVKVVRTEELFERGMLFVDIFTVVDNTLYSKIRLGGGGCSQLPVAYNCC